MLYKVGVDLDGRRQRRKQYQQDYYKRNYQKICEYKQLTKEKRRIYDKERWLRRKAALV